jgi:hypothetical protein
MFIDLDSTICEVHGDAKQGATYDYTRQLGLDQLLDGCRQDVGQGRGNVAPVPWRRPAISSIADS